MSVMISRTKDTPTNLEDAFSELIGWLGRQQDENNWTREQSPINNNIYICKLKYRGN